MRNRLIVWLVMALLVFGTKLATRAGEELEISGFVNATDQEAEEGNLATSR